MWYVTMAFRDLSGLLILFANSMAVAILLNDNIPFFKYAIDHNHDTYIMLISHIYGYRAVLYSYNCVKYTLRATDAAFYIEDYLYKETESAYI
jgi:hypothetical protein